MLMPLLAAERTFPFLGLIFVCCGVFCAFCLLCFCVSVCWRRNVLRRPCGAVRSMIFRIPIPYPVSRVPYPGGAWNQRPVEHSSLASIIPHPGTGMVVRRGKPPL